MKINLYSKGAAETVTGSRHYIECGKTVVQIDSGMFQGKAEEKNKEATFPNVDAVILTHAHLDHIGMLPKQVKEGYEGKIYCTPATRDLATVVLNDSAKIQSYDKENPLYTDEDVVKTLNYFSCKMYEKEKKINNDISFKFYNAGHILGSSMIDLKINTKKFLFGKKEIHVLFSGDLGRNGNPLVSEPATNMPAPDYIVLESTYGDRTHKGYNTIEQELTYTINRTVDRGGKVIIPSFAVERTQELIFYIKKLMKEEKIPRVPMYIDSPMAVAATGVFSIHSESLNDNIRNNFVAKGKNPFTTKSLKFINSYEESLKIAKSKKPCIIISAQGMIEAGRIINHVKYGISDPNNTILFVGYMCEGTLGRKILDKEPVVTIDKKDYELKAEVQKIEAFSAHSDYKEMLEWLSKIDTSKLKKIFLVHGDKNAQEHFSKFLKDNGFDNEIIKENIIYKL